MRELAMKAADDRAHRIATIAAEELVRTEGEATGAPDEYRIPQCQADDHMRECIEQFGWLMRPNPRYTSPLIHNLAGTGYGADLGESNGAPC